MDEQDQNMNDAEQQDTDVAVDDSNLHSAEDEKQPSSMLEAIEAGLKEGCEQAAAAPNDDNPLDSDAATEEPKLKGADQKQADDDDLSMPDGLSVAAQQKFQKLTGRLQEASDALQTAHANVQEFREMIKESRATPQEFAQAIDYMRMVKTGDLENALHILDDQRRQISLALGRPLPGADPLAAFPDLRQRVDGYQMDEQAAIELARARVMQQQTQQIQHEQYQGMQREQALTQARGQAIAAIDQLGAQWAQTDPDFTAKEEIILKQLPEIARHFPPDMWPQQVKILYDTLSAMPVPTAHRVSAPAPLRASGQSAGSRQPSNMLEALQAGLGYAQH